MSNKKSSKKPAGKGGKASTGKASKKGAKKAPVQKKPPVKAIIIAAVAVLLAAAVAVTVYFVKKNDDNTRTTFSGEIETYTDEDTNHAYANYKGGSLRAELVEVLLQADADKAAACEEYGVALEIGDIEVSVPEFVMYYYHIYYNKLYEVEYAIQKTGENRTGFDPEVLPSEQNHVSEPYSWEEAFTRDAIEQLQNDYMIFEMALEEGYKPDGMTNEAILDSLKTIDSVEKDITEFYCDGVTKNMYKANEIITRIAQAYENKHYYDIQSRYTQADIEKEFKKDEGKYTVAKVRVYPIEGTFNKDKADEVKTEKDLINFAQSNFPGENYDAEFATDCGYITKEKLSSVYGEEVGTWVFDSKRKSGDIEVIKAPLFDYIVYVDVPAFHSTSVNVMLAPTEPDTTNMTQEEFDKAIDNAEKEYLKWKNDEGSKDGFYNYSTAAGGTGEITARIGDYNFLLDNWMFDSSRKEGDYTFIETPTGCCAIYFIGKNEDDFDWISNAKADMANAELDELYADLRVDEYEPERNARELEKAWQEADKSIQRQWKRAEEASAEAEAESKN